jgi:hypothetical protein
MTFDEVLAQVLDILQRQGRVSYGALQRRFALDDAYLADLKTELMVLFKVLLLVQPHHALSRRNRPGLRAQHRPHQ